MGRIPSPVETVNTGICKHHNPKENHEFNSIYL